MNILITLPKDLIAKIISGEKKFEMRRCLPKKMQIGKDGFFVVEKGTDEVRCWCRVDECNEVDVDHFNIRVLSYYLCVPIRYIMKYANGKKVYLWGIGMVIEYKNVKRHVLDIDKNPQQFTYCTWSPCRYF